MGAIAGAAQQNSHDSPLNAALFSAIHAGDAVSLQLALTRGADKNAKSHGTPAITMCVQAGHLELVRLLAAVEVDMNALDTQGLSPLAHAQARGMQNMQLLLKELSAK